MKKVTFNDEFEAKLKKLRIKKKFLNNVIKYSQNAEKHIKAISAIQSWPGFISGAFVWSRTEEGHDYWKKISLK